MQWQALKINRESRWRAEIATSACRAQVLSREDLAAVGGWTPAHHYMPSPLSSSISSSIFGFQVSDAAKMKSRVPDLELVPFLHPASRQPSPADIHPLHLYLQLAFLCGLHLLFYIKDNSEKSKPENVSEKGKK